jgi:hypothetical protein
MTRTTLLLAATLTLSLAAPALADDPSDPTKAVDDALADKAMPPAKPPVLPSTASEHAVNAHEHIAFGKNGDLHRHAHSQADRMGQHDAADAHADAANRAAQGAAMSAMGQANADAHAAAGMNRSEQARGHMGTGGMTGTGTNTGMGHR